METHIGGGDGNQLLRNLGSFMRKCMFRILSVDEIPNHVAFVLDGNRRYARKHNLELEAGYRAAFLSLLSILKYCSELGVKYVSVYAFSIDNFKRCREEVQFLMDLMLEKIELLLKEESVVNQYGIRVHIIGSLKLLGEPLRIAAEKVMKATANNTKIVICVCVAYTSSNEIIHAVQRSCIDKLENHSEACHDDANECVEEHEAEKTSVVKLVDVEKHMYMSVAPDPDIVIRTSGENRLSNFLLWQTTHCVLYSPAALWPEIGLWHLIRAVINFQRFQSYFQKKRKRL